MARRKLTGLLITDPFKQEKERAIYKSCLGYIFGKRVLLKEIFLIGIPPIHKFWKENFPKKE